MPTPKQVIALAESQLGEHESPSGSNLQKFGAWYGMNGVAWCFIFVSWVFDHAGYRLPNMGTSKGGQYTPDGVAWAKAHGMWDASGRYSPGDIIFFTWGTRHDSAGRALAQHVGIVVSDDGRNVRTIEGNVGAYGGSVERKVRPHGSSILGVLKASKWLTGSSPVVTPPPVVTPTGPATLPGVPGDGGSTGHPNLKRGTTGGAVKHLQSLLVKYFQSSVQVDGDFGPATDGSVRAFQKAKKLTVDGEVGPATWKALHVPVLAAQAPAPAPKPPAPPVVSPPAKPPVTPAVPGKVRVPLTSKGSNDSRLPGSPVTNLQRQLRAHGFKGSDGLPITVDGDFGANTEYAVRRLQTLYGLPVTGKADGLTLATVARM